MARPLTQDKIEIAENLFREYLRDRGLKYTPERRMVLLEVLATDEHFEAEQLLFSIRQQSRRVAKATIYRTLPLLVQCGIVKRVQFGENLTRYEHTFDEGPHDHMVCERCHRIIEFDNADVVRLRTVIVAKHRFHTTAHRFQISGLCWECVQACPAADRPFVPSENQATSRGRRRSGSSAPES